MDPKEERDHARGRWAHTLAEPYRIKMVERLRLPSRAERELALRRAQYSPFHLDSSDVYVDLLTDSGMGAMSDEQWSAMMRGDEAYVRSRSYFGFESAVREITGFPHVLPTHQGRAAEGIVMSLLVRPGDVVLNNTHFDTTKAHVEHREALALDLVSDVLWRFDESHPFKGNFDLAKLEAALSRFHERVPFIIITVLNNFACSSPVSMANIREVKRLADRYAKPVFFDACRFAENAHFIKTREPGYAERSVAEIVREMFSYGAGCWMSAKKDAIVNIGGFIATHDAELAARCRERVVLQEGFHSYGGLARRDLEAIAVGLREGIDDDYLEHRTGLVAYLGALLEHAGAVVSKPVGGSGVFLDVQALYPHLTPDELPNVALCSDMYLEGGVRVGAAPFSMQTVSPASAEIEHKVFHMARFAVPRRTYTKAHMEFVAEVFACVREVAGQSRGYRVVSAPKELSHFFATFAPL